MRRHSNDLRDFWVRFQRGAEVAVAGLESDQSLGVRDGFVHFLRDAIHHPVAIAVVPQDDHTRPRRGLSVSDSEALAAVAKAAAGLRDRFGGEYQFYVATESGEQLVEIEGQTRRFLRLWAAISSPFGTAFGGSASFEIHPDEEGRRAAASVTRREGGFFRSVTSGLESRRSAVASATGLALASLFHERWEPVERGPRG